MNRLTRILIKINDFLVVFFATMVPDFFKEILESVQFFISLKWIEYINSRKKITPKRSRRKSYRKKRNNSPDTPIFIGGILVTLAIFIGGSFIYYNAKKIIRGLENQVRDPSSAGINKRVSYYGLERHHIALPTVQIEIQHRRGQKTIEYAKIDFIVETSNIYLKNYISENEYEFQDIITNTLQPIIRPQLFTEEGQKIIKERIEIELNIYIQEKNIEGRIQRVSIGKIISR